MFFLPTCLRSLFIHCAAAGNAVDGRTGGGGAAPAGERCSQQTAVNSLQVGDLFQKLVQKTEEAGVVPI